MSKTYFIDVREPAEFSAGHITGAINIPPRMFLTGEAATRLKKVPLDSQLVVYCLSGSRSNMAIIRLKELGYTHLVNGINQGQVRSRFKL